MMRFFFFILFILYVGFPFLGFCEAVTLTSGKVVEGKILEKTKDFVKMDIEGITVTYYTSEIKDIKDAKDNPLQVINITIKSKQNQPESNLIRIPINAMIDLNFKTKQEIYELRKKAVMQFPDLLVNKDYVPNEEVFGQIIDKKPWWGILGLCYTGPGQSSITGPSEESRFLLNPFLLVGLNDLNAYIVDDKKLAPSAIYPAPVSLSWKADRKYASVTYDVTNFWIMAKRYHYGSADTRQLELIAYNAKDMGFNYMCLSPEKSKNISTNALVKEPIAIKQFIHCGPSCGYPGGCNNMSPRQDELVITVVKVPATAYLKLWYDKPQDCQQPENMGFVIEIK